MCSEFMHNRIVVETNLVYLKICSQLSGETRDLGGVSDCGKLRKQGWECEVVGSSSFPRTSRASRVGVITTTFSVRTGEPKDYTDSILLRCYPLISNFDETRRGVAASI